MDLVAFLKVGGKAAIVGVVVWLLVYGLRHAIWPKVVPSIVSKLRWVIALVIGFVLIVVKAALGFDPSGTIVNGGVIYVVAETLKNGDGATP